jgi:hypothetical protein
MIFDKCRGAAMSLGRRGAVAERTLSAKTKPRTPSAPPAVAGANSPSARSFHTGVASFECHRAAANRALVARSFYTSGTPPPPPCFSYVLLIQGLQARSSYVWQMQGLKMSVFILLNPLS